MAALASSAAKRRVLIAGAGVAGLEAMLALTELAGDRVDVCILAPDERFVHRPMLVAEPFGGAEAAASLEIEALVSACGARRVADSLASVDSRSKAVTTASGERLGYDSLLVALGARPTDAVPGALTFAGEAERRAFGDLLARLGHRDMKRLAFIVPAAATWSLAAYELALLTAAEREARRLDGVSLVLLTHERAPLQLLGEPASALVAARLAEAGVELLASTRASRFERRAVGLSDGSTVEADAAVALPRLVGPRIEGLPQTAEGFLPADVRMHVNGFEDVLVAGDAGSFPIKQGGLAAQQAEIAARAIAARAGAKVPLQAFEPVLRAALITGGSVGYFRRPMHDRDRVDAAEGRALWWPPAKVAGQRLAAVLSAGDPGVRAELVDVAPIGPEHEPNARSATALLLAAADADAAVEDYPSALHWLALVERLNLVLPPAYVALRDEWRREVDSSAIPGAAARRIDPQLAGAEAALSDLRRRLGWLRAIERRQEGEMGAHLAALGGEIEHLLALSRRGGTLGEGPS